MKTEDKRVRTGQFLYQVSGTRMCARALLMSSLDNRNCGAPAYFPSRGGFFLLPMASQVQEDGPTDADVIFGRGNGANYHPGNIRFRQLTLRKVEAYCEARRREQKDELARQLLAEVEQNGGRFLKSVEVTTSEGETVSVWEVVPPNKVLAKVKQALRDAALSHKRNPGRATGSSPRKEAPRTPIEVRTPELPSQGSTEVARRHPYQAEASGRSPPQQDDRPHGSRSSQEQPHVQAMLQKMQYDELTRNQQLIGTIATTPSHPHARLFDAVGSQATPTGELVTAPVVQPTAGAHHPEDDRKPSSSSLDDASRPVRTKRDDAATVHAAKRPRPSSPSTPARQPQSPSFEGKDDDDPSESVYLPHSPSLSRDQKQQRCQLERKASSGNRPSETARSESKSEQTHTEAKERSAESGTGAEEEDAKSKKKKKQRFGDRLEI